MTTFRTPAPFPPWEDAPVRIRHSFVWIWNRWVAQVDWSHDQLREGWFVAPAHGHTREKAVARLQRNYEATRTRWLRRHAQA